MMTALDEVFLEVARTESRAIDAVDHAGHRTRFLFRELYCADPGCDCRRVLVQVLAVDTRAIAASIGYSFEAPQRRGEAQLELDPFNPQGPRAQALLDVFADLLENDRGYRPSLVRHYEMMKRSPAAAARAVPPSATAARGETTKTTKSTKATKTSAGKTKQGRAKTGAAGAGTLARVAARADAGTDESKEQKGFRRLLAKVDRLKQQVREWQERRPEIMGVLARFEAARARLGPVLRELTVVLDRGSADPGLSKPDRRFLAEMIASLAHELISGGDHDDLKPIYNRHARADVDAEAAEADAEAARTFREMFEAMAMDFGDADVGSMEKLNAHTTAEIERAREAEAPPPRPRRRTARQRAAERAREEERLHAERALQDVYRQLARAHHPDREQDPAERVRKTALMREVNVAYEAKDLLRLLELQLALEEVGAEQVGAQADDRLPRYNRVLDEQAGRLTQELEELEATFRIELGLAPRGRLTPGQVLVEIHGDIEAVEARIAAVAQDLVTLRDPRRLRPWLREQRRAEVRERAIAEQLGLGDLFER
jgi:hypothetical protein